ELLDLDIRLGEVYSFAALGFAYLGNNEQAILYANKCIAIDASNEHAYLALLFAKEETMEVNEIDELIPAQMRNSPQIAINMGSFYDKLHKHEQAFDIYKKLDADYEQLDAFKCDIMVQMATNRIQSLTKNEEYFYGQLSE